MSSNEPNLGKNYWLALGLSMIVLMGYPVILKWITPPTSAPVDSAETVGSQPVTTNAPAEPALSKAKGPFLEKPSASSTVAFENRNYQVEFSTLGGTLTRLFYKGDAEHEAAAQNSFYEGDPALPGIFGTGFLHDDIDLTQAIFQLNRRGKNNDLFEFVYEKPGSYRLTKQFFLGSEKPVIGLEITIENLSSNERHFPIELTYAMDYQFEEGITDHNFEAAAKTDKVTSAHLGKILKKGFPVSGEVSWSGLLKKYFAILIKPDWKAIEVTTSANEKTMSSALTLEPLSVPAGGKATHQFFLYVGPQHYETLKSFDFGFEEILSRGFFGLFKIWLLIALKFLYGFVHNYGWAIILLTLLLKGVFTPLTHMSFENMKKMQALQPKLKSLQERYKKDPTKLNQEMMQLYKRNRVNPMMGCLPMLLQIPIFIAFYQVLSDMIELRGAPFVFWMRDLAAPDRLWTFSFSIPFIGNAFNLLPLLMLASMVWQQKLTPMAGSTPEQTKMMQFMPIMFGFLFYKMPSGLVLYWFISNVLSIIHQVFVKRMAIVLHHEDQE